jgi:hypothetical protein
MCNKDLCILSVWLFVRLLLCISFRSLFLFLSLVLATPVLFELGAPNGRLIIDQRMQRDNSSQEAAEINDEQRVVRAARKANSKSWVSQVGQQIERVLEEVDDLVVHGHRSVRDVDEISLDVG